MSTDEKPARKGQFTPGNKAAVGSGRGGKRERGIAAEVRREKKRLLKLLWHTAEHGTDSAKVKAQIELSRIAYGNPASAREMNAVEPVDAPGSAESPSSVPGLAIEPEGLRRLSHAEQAQWRALAAKAAGPYGAVVLPARETPPIDLSTLTMEQLEALKVVQGIGLEVHSTDTSKTISDRLGLVATLERFAAEGKEEDERRDAELVLARAEVVRLRAELSATCLPLPVAPQPPKPSKQPDPPSPPEPEPPFPLNLIRFPKKEQP